MKKIIIIALSILLISTISLFPKSKATINWYEDIDAAFEAAKNEDKLIMVDVYTDWCYWCTELDNKTYARMNVRKKATEFISLKVNPETSEEGSEFALKYNVQGFPDIIFLDKNGTIVHRIGGFLPANDFVIEMQSALDMVTRLDTLIKGHEEGDLESTAKLLSHYMETGNLTDAQPLITLLDKNDKLSIEEKIRYYNSTGYSYVEQGKYLEAKTAFEQNINSFTTKDNLYEHNFAAYYIGYCLMMLNKKSEATSYINTYIEKNELDPSVEMYFDQLLIDLTNE